MKNDRPDITLPKALIPIIGVAVVVLVVLFAFSTGSTVLFIGILVAPLLLLMVNSPGLWLIWILGISKSGLVLPGMPTSLQVVHLFSFGFTLLVLARFIIMKPAPLPRRISDQFLKFFILVVIVTAGVRGVGLRAFGGEMWGGMGYIKLTLGAFFLLASQHVTLNMRQLKTAMFLLLGFSLLPVIAQTLFIVSRGALYQQYFFIDPGQGGFSGFYYSATAQVAVERYQTLKGFGDVLLMCGLILIPWERRHIPLHVLVASTALFLTGYSGFRSAILIMLGTLFFLLLIRSQNKRATLAVMAVAAAFCYAIAIPIVPHMPDPVQRAFSWVPGLDIRSDIAMDAYNTTTWRLEVWKLAWNEVSSYLWIGKGFSIVPDDVLSYTARMDSVLGAFLAHNYHSGPLTLLLDLGVLGFITGVGFLIFSCVEEVRESRKIPKNPFVQRFFYYLLAQFVSATISYFVIFGDVRESFTSMFISLALLRTIARVSDAPAPAVPAVAASAVPRAARMQPRPVP